MDIIDLPTPGSLRVKDVVIPKPEVVPIPTDSDGSKYNSRSSLDI